MRIAKPGWFVILRCAVSAGICLYLCRYPGLRPGCQVVVAVGVVWACFAAYFFRDPERRHPDDADKIYSPGDGRVLSIEQEGPDDETTIRIFLSIFNVHLQRAPCAGTITDAEYIKGSFRAAMKHAARANERCVIRIEPKGRPGTVVVEQIAGLIARRIECWKGIGDAVAAGERYGMIHFGSQVAVTLPGTVRVTVLVGDNVTAGVTPIAEWIA
ncbi:MAG: phosphatidylserine decarboxylase [Elusimicrobia bacterium]|nr:phosphatidylserine decarboxylase [Elusimicrobiota bacterium]